MHTLGILGLQHLVHFAERGDGTAQRILTEVNASEAGYPFACCGINITSLVLSAVRSGAARGWLLRRAALTPFSDRSTVSDVREDISHALYGSLRCCGRVV